MVARRQPEREARKASVRERIAQLERQQGIGRDRPDYVALFSRVWPTVDDARQFRREIRANRRSSND
jgi:hypothetical protein